MYNLNFGILFSTKAITAMVLAMFLSAFSSKLPGQEIPAWVAQSNAYSQILLEVIAENSPETASRLGVDGYDEAIMDLSPGYRERYLKDLEAAKNKLSDLLEKQEDGPVRQDLDILVGEAGDNMEEIRLQGKYFRPYYDVPSLIYNGIRALLEDRIPDERRQLAAARLNKYTGLEKGFRPLAELAMEEMRDGMADTTRLSPFREEVERNLNSGSEYLNEIGVLLEKYKIGGYKKGYQALKDQVQRYNTFVRTEILPHARDDFKVPQEVYAFRLKGYGGDMPVDELQRRAKVSFKELQAQMQLLAGEIAKKYNLPSGDYREVIRYLKSQQLDSAAILPLYRRHMEELEGIIRREGIVTLPQREMKIRLATPAESASSPAPFFRPPRLIGNTGELGEFVLPLKLTGGAEGSSLKIDDFTHESASWMLAAHEGRPGHELQYASIIEKGVSQARAIFARNSVNSEGWALYMEEQVLPYIPIEGQLFTLWSRAFRASRAFLDPGLNLGTLNTEEAHYILSEVEMASEGLTRGELERYRYRAPGQATSYFNGYLRLMELRAETELALGPLFNKQAFHDFILAQGLLPPRLLRKAILDSFIPSVRDAAKD